MKNTSKTLKEILARSFKGNKAALADASGVDRSFISRLCNDGKCTPPTSERLQSLADAMCSNDARQLLLAASRDYIPEKYHALVFQSSTASELIRSHLPADIAAIIRFLESDAMENKSTADFLRGLAEITGIRGGNHNGDPIDQDQEITGTDAIKDQSRGSQGA